jgi:hypothetical protein
MGELGQLLLAVRWPVCADAQMGFLFVAEPQMAGSTH